MNLFLLLVGISISISIGFVFATVVVVSKERKKTKEVCMKFTKYVIDNKCEDLFLNGGYIMDKWKDYLYQEFLNDTAV